MKKLSKQTARDWNNCRTRTNNGTRTTQFQNNNPNTASPMNLFPMYIAAFIFFHTTYDCKNKSGSYGMYGLEGNGMHGMYVMYGQMGCCMVRGMLIC